MFLLFHIYLFCLWALKFCLPIFPVHWSGFQLYFSVGLREFFYF
jgi:hypothetical protein